MREGRRVRLGVAAVEDSQTLTLSNAQTCRSVPMGVATVEVTAMQVGVKERRELFRYALALLGSGLVQDRMRVRKAADQARNGRKAESSGKKER